MTLHTKSAHYAVTPDQLFAYLSNIENLPDWAVTFANSIRKDGDDYLVKNAGGELFVHFKTDAATGVIDIYAGPSVDMMWCWPTRVTADNMGGSVYTFTCVKMPQQSDEEFDGQLCALAEELDIIRSKVIAKAA